MSSVHLEEDFNRSIIEMMRTYYVISSFEQPIMPVNIPNSYERIYRQEIVEHIINTKSDLMLNRRMVGEYGIKYDSIVRLEHVSHYVSRMFLRDYHNELYWYAHIEIINSPMGTILRNVINGESGPINISFIPYGFGRLTDANEVYDYDLIALNAVH